MTYLKIDGSMGEGGGAILRLSAAFSVLFNQPIRIFNIRANRSRPGLRLQHLLGLRLLSEISGAKLSDCQVGTTSLTFEPEKNKGNDNTFFKVGTAASLGLLVQPTQIAALDLPSQKISIELDGGGTFGKWAPSVNYLKHVTYPIYQKAGLNIDVNIKKHGFYPKGGAHTEFTLHPPQKPLNGLNITELGNIETVQGEIIITDQLKGHDIPERIIHSLKEKIKRQTGINDFDITTNWVRSLSAGVGLSLWGKSDTDAIISTGTILGEKRVPSEKVGKNAADELLKYLKNDIPVDDYLSDQLIPLMAYNESPSAIRVLKITKHTETNLELLQLFKQREYTIEEEENSTIIRYN